MKRFISFVVALAMILSLASFAQAADYSLAINNNVAVMVGNTNAIAKNSIITLPIAPVIENDTVLVPVRFVAEAFNGAVSWDEAKREVTIKFGAEREAQMVIDSPYVNVNGQIYVADAAPKIVNGYTMLPVNFLAETVLGKNVYYNAENQMAVITNRKALSDRDTEAVSTIASALKSGVLPEIVVKAPVIEDVGGALGGANAETGKLTIVSVNADQEPEAENNGSCMIDGSTSTRWASQGAASATLDLGAAKPVTHVRVAVWKPTERNTNYSIEVSANGGTWTKIFDGQSTGATFDSYDVNDTIRYIRINPNGTSAGDWASILEVEAWNGTATVTGGGTGGAAGSVVASPTGSKETISAASVQVSQLPEPENDASKMLDNNKQTVWASQGDATATFDLGSSKTISCVGVSMKMYEDDRTIPYDISVSSDGVSFTQVFTGSSDPMTDAVKYVSIGAAGRYVRIGVHGNTISGWSSVAEVEIYTGGAATAVTTPTTTTTTTTDGGFLTAPNGGTKVTLTQNAIEVSQLPEPENHAGNMIDGNKMTVWASQGVGVATFDLGAAKTVTCVGVAMKLYEDDRTIPFDVEVSADGTTYTMVFTGSSVPQSDATMYVPVNSSVRYVRLTAHGNTVSAWNSVAEVEIYAN